MLGFKAFQGFLGFPDDTKETRIHISHIFKICKTVHSRRLLHFHFLLFLSMLKLQLNSFQVVLLTTDK